MIFIHYVDFIRLQGTLTNDFVAEQWRKLQ